MHRFLVSASLLIILGFIFTVKPSGDPTFSASEIWINCGSTGTSTSIDGRKWVGDKHPNFTIKGYSTRSSVTSEPINSIDSVPYKTVRLSRSQFSYIFELSSGQKFVTLHFNPTLYHGFERYKDLFNVEVGQFTLLSNFNASVTADALGVNSFVKEFCIIVEENQPLNITFYPATTNGQSQDIYAFVNGIEIISVHESISFCHTTETGVQVVGEKSMVYIDKSTALEMVYRRSLKVDPVLPNNDSRGRFGMWAEVLNKNVKNVNNITWRVPVDIGFRYLVRLHFCELGLNLAKSNNKSFVLLIDHVTVNTSAEIFRDMEDRHSMFYKNYMVIAKGRKEDDKRDILISLQSEDEFIYRHGPLEGFEIFKLSNHYNSFASPNPLLPIRDSLSLTIQYPQTFSSHRNTIAAIFITLICLVNVIVHILRQTCDAIFPEEETTPSTRAARLCRHFSLSEIKSATKNFRDNLIIGKGGFGIVYKGLIDNGRSVVAVKRLKTNSKQGEREFWKEIETLSELRHTNLVPLIGYCNEQSEMILVYAYMPNGTLADHLYKLARRNKSYSFLSWEDRLKICIGAGRGLDYLHSGHGIIHRDVKASNILLDETFVSKVSDFGLVKSEKEIQFQSQESSPKGTFGYFDPDYFRTCKLTMKSDTYSFGVVLLEVLCGRPAVDPLAGEDMHSLTVWALDNIRRGEADKIVAQSLRGEILPDSLKAFVEIAEKCLHDEPKRRPMIAHVIINLEFVLEQQNANSLAPNRVASVADILPRIDRIQQGSTTSLLPREIVGVLDFLPRTDRTSMSTQDITTASPSTPISTSFLKEQANNRILNPEPPYRKNDSKKTILRKISRILPWETKSWKRSKVPKKSDFGISMSAPILKNTNSKAPSRGSTSSATGGGNDLSSTSNFRIFSFLELKAATKGFRTDAVLGQGGFGGVYKGYLEERPTNRKGSVSVIPIAIKRLTSGSKQGFREWLAEVSFLGRLSHPNLVNLLGYCHEKKELLLVYEFMQNNSLDRHLFSKDSAQALPWNLRLKILTGAARGLAYLHTIPIIHRDLKTSNILLDKSYNAKISDFGLAKDGPDEGGTHVSTRVAGTVGYLAPEYMMTGHLTAKGDVYSFGVILLEILTGLSARDAVKEQRHLIGWIEPLLKNEMELKKFMDSRLEGRYPPKSAIELFQLAGNCLKYDKKARPLMNEVVEILERADMIDEIPREPRVRFINEDDD